MNIIQINSVLYGSTGKIMLQIKKKLQEQKNLCYMAVPKGRHNFGEVEDVIWIGNQLSEDSHIILGRITGLQGAFSTFATFRLLKKIDRLRPDVVQLHNLHNSYINLPLLFNYLRKHDIAIVWTLHDCWAFTGHCPHFTVEKCNKWKDQCKRCSKYKDYPKCYFDHSRIMYRLKRKWFGGLKRMTIVTPSQWLAGMVKQSFLKEYPVTVINNGIDLDVFKPTESNFRNKYNILEDTHILLGVAFGWSEKKGLDIFIELSNRLSSCYQIVLVGTDERIDQLLPSNIIKIHRTENQHELAAIYSAADVFINPSKEENYPTVDMESIACGTPVITFNVGGGPEIVNRRCGVVLASESIEMLQNECIRICTEQPFSCEDCCKEAKKFDLNKKIQEYINLYNGGCDDGTSTN